MEEYRKPAVDRSLTILSACAFAMLILHATQPPRTEMNFVKEENEFLLRTSEMKCEIELPEYSHNAFMAMENALESEAHSALRKLCEDKAFVICVERSVVYSTHSKIPFPPRSVIG